MLTDCGMAVDSGLFKKSCPEPVEWSNQQDLEWLVRS